MAFLLFIVFGFFSSLAAMQPEIKGLMAEEAEFFWLQASDGTKISLPLDDAKRSTVLKDFIAAGENSEQNPLPLNFPSATVNLLKRMINPLILAADIRELTSNQLYALYSLAWYLGAERIILLLNEQIAALCIKDPDILKKLTGNINGQLLAGVNEKNFNKKLFELNQWLSPLRVSRTVSMSMQQVQEIIRSRAVVQNPLYPEEVIRDGVRYAPSGGERALLGASWSSDGTMLVGSENNTYIFNLYDYDVEPGSWRGRWLQDLRGSTDIHYGKRSAWSHDDKIIATLRFKDNWAGRAYGSMIELWRKSSDGSWQKYTDFFIEHQRNEVNSILFDFNTEDSVLITLIVFGPLWLVAGESNKQVLEDFIVFLKPETLSMNQTLLILVLEELNKTDAGKKRIQGSVSAIRDALQTYNQARQAIAEKYGLGAMQIPAYTAADILRDFPAQRVLPQVAAGEVKAVHAAIVDDVSRELALLHSSLTALAS